MSRPVFGSGDRSGIIAIVRSPGNPPPHRETISIARPTIVYVALFGAVGAWAPYLSVHFASIGLPLEVIGLLTALTAAVGLVAAPGWGALVDRFRTVPTLLAAAALCSAGAAGWLAIARDPVGITLAVAALAVGMSGLAPMLDSRTVEMLGDERDRFARARAWGSASFVVVALLVGGIIERTSPVALFWALVPAFLVTAVAALALLGGRGSGGRARIVRELRGFAVAEILRAPGLALFFVGLVVLWTAVEGLVTFASIRVVEVGGGAAAVGAVWALGAITEVPLMLAFPAVAGRVGAGRLVVVGAAAFALRGLGWAVTSDPAVLVALAPLAGVGFAFCYVGTVSHVARTVPADLGATAQGLFSGTAFSVGTILGAMIAGALARTGDLAIVFAVSAAGTGLASAILWRSVAAPMRDPSPTG